MGFDMLPGSIDCFFFFKNQIWKIFIRYFFRVFSYPFFFLSSISRTSNYVYARQIGIYVSPFLLL
jgi:hypothetical protein